MAREHLVASLDPVIASTSHQYGGEEIALWHTHWPKRSSKALLHRVGDSHMAWRAFERIVTLEYAHESGLNAFKHRGQLQGTAVSTHRPALRALERPGTSSP